MLSREVDPREAVVVSFGQVESGTAYNVIPEQANLWGTLRAFNPKTRDFVQSRIETVAPAIAKALRGLASVEYTRNYAQIENNLDMLEDILRIGVPFFGEDGINMLERPLLSGEDFSFFTHNVPSVFMLLGTGLEYPLHHPRYDVPESMLPFSAAWALATSLVFISGIASPPIRSVKAPAAEQSKTPCCEYCRLRLATRPQNQNGRQAHGRNSF